MYNFSSLYAMLKMFWRYESVIFLFIYFMQSSRRNSVRHPIWMLTPFYKHSLVLAMNSMLHVARVMKKRNKSVNHTVTKSPFFPIIFWSLSLCVCVSVVFRLNAIISCLQFLYCIRRTFSRTIVVCREKKTHIVVAMTKLPSDLTAFIMVF